MASKNAMKHGLSRGVDTMDPSDSGRMFVEAEQHAARTVKHLASILEPGPTTDAKTDVPIDVNIWSAIRSLERLERYRLPRLRRWLGSVTDEFGRPR